jgi:pimeloyl-ACP methyl ester carboxylesterase
MGHSGAFGAAPGECLEVLRRIRTASPEGWYSAWSGAAKTCERLSVTQGDPVSRGKALLRAANYHRTSEVFLPADDPRRLETHRLEADAFQRALKTLNIPHKAWNIPYERVSLRAYYFPGEAARPLVVACGGFDSSLEELFFWMGHAAFERGHPCILFEGPGQSNMLREYRTAFIPEWEKPLMIVLDHAQWEAPEASKSVKVLAGLGMGGMLALRAAAKDRRIHAVGSLGGFFSMETVAFERLTAPARWAYRLGMKGLFNRLAAFASSRDMEMKTALEHGLWAMGASTPFDLMAKTAEFSILPVARDIACHVLVVQGERDHLVPAREAAFLKRHLTRAKDVRVITIEGPSGAGEHCQAGALERLHQVFFGWAEGFAHADAPAQ